MNTALPMVSELLNALLRSVLDLRGALERAANDSASFEYKKLSLMVVDAHKRIEIAIDEGHLHYKTQRKLLDLIDQNSFLIEICRVVGQDSSSEQFDPRILLSELSVLVQSAVTTINPVARYYALKAFKLVKVIWDQTWDRALEDAKLHELNQQEILRQEEAPLSQFAERLTKSNSQGLDNKIGPTEVPVYFGTTRSLNTDSKAPPALRYRQGRGSGKLSLGRAIVSIPAGHQIGKLERPLSIWTMRLRENPKKHVLLRTVEVLSSDDWVSSIQNDLQELKRPTAFVFIHGFNVAFDQAIMRAGQIARDIQYEGLVTAFSWGSEAAINSYLTDGDTVEIAVPELIEFLAILHKQAGITDVHIVGHSMGCRAMLGAINDTSWWSTAKTPISQAVFAAPDVDAMRYRQVISSIPNNVGRYTLYGSERDRAIVISRSIRGSYPRAGDGGKNILVMNGVETVDATAVGASLFGLGHSYIAEKRSILTDLWAVFQGMGMPRFGLQTQKHANGQYWTLLA